ncbi:Pimeloyl-ACP methyl ester carboxylesterase [Paraoerskovia marina]|uniref:Pimeloyl-ACP methyl ester carboxylesterase n=1 Tax=Paraoerskovia marina TaxID=545619 RepID=A0A1H1R6T4_9CELL|nr:alpha/beta hydrolase [Paraoerskovia marina]SDS31524.1 Pimeloyl-ACP methyl ester carboxylesterase [Paraoerskovia marina]
MTERLAEGLPPLEIRTLRQGHGQPVLLLHAFPVDHRMWSPVAQLFPTGQTVLAIDSYGAGHDALWPETPSLDLAADAVVSALHRAGFDRAVVAGLSMGGYLALAIADRHPDVVAGLGLLDTKSTADTPEALANRARSAEAMFAERSVNPVLGMAASLPSPESIRKDPGLTSRVEELILRQQPEGLAWCQRAMAARPDRTGVVTVAPGPVLVLVGSEDRTTPVSASEHMVVARRDAELVVLPDVGHLSALEAPQAVTDALVGLIERSSPV